MDMGPLLELVADRRTRWDGDKAIFLSDEQARAILATNDRGGYTVPTAGLYPYQWNWDSAFAGWGFATFDVDRAWTELENLFAGQWPTERVHHHTRLMFVGIDFPDFL